MGSFPTWKTGVRYGAITNFSAYLDGEVRAEAKEQLTRLVKYENGGEEVPSGEEDAVLKNIDEVLDFVQAVVKLDLTPPVDEASVANRLADSLKPALEGRKAQGKIGPYLKSLNGTDLLSPEIAKGVEKELDEALQKTDANELEQLHVDSERIVEEALAAVDTKLRDESDPLVASKPSVQKLTRFMPAGDDDGGRKKWGNCLEVLDTARSCDRQLAEYMKIAEQDARLKSDSRRATLKKLKSVGNKLSDGLAKIYEGTFPVSENVYSKISEVLQSDGDAHRTSVETRADALWDAKHTTFGKSADTVAAVHKGSCGGADWRDLLADKPTTLGTVLGAGKKTIATITCSNLEDCPWKYSKALDERKKVIEEYGKVGAVADDEWWTARQAKLKRGWETVYEKKLYTLLQASATNAQFKVDLAKVTKQHKDTSQKCHPTLEFIRTQISQGRLDLAATRKTVLKELEEQEASAGKKDDEKIVNDGVKAAADAD
jgi:hypothetical protein